MSKAVKVTPEKSATWVLELEAALLGVGLFAGLYGYQDFHPVIAILAGAGVGGVFYLLVTRVAPLFWLWALGVSAAAAFGAWTYALDVTQDPLWAGLAAGTAGLVLLAMHWQSWRHTRLRRTADDVRVIHG